jgi:hypothetical protein
METANAYVAKSDTECAFEFITENWATLRGICTNYCRGRYDLVDDMFSDVVYDHVLSGMRTFDPAFGKELPQHVFYHVGWYCLKWMTSRMQKCNRAPTLTDLYKGGEEFGGLDREGWQRAGLTHAADETLDVDHNEATAAAVETLLSVLTPQERSIFVWRERYDWTFAAIGFQCGKSESWAKLKFHETIIPKLEKQLSACGYDRNQRGEYVHYEDA